MVCVQRTWRWQRHPIPASADPSSTSVLGEDVLVMWVWHRTLTLASAGQSVVACEDVPLGVRSVSGHRWAHVSASYTVELNAPGRGCKLHIRQRKAADQPLFH
jgi:hypothetical protein